MLITVIGGFNWFLIAVFDFNVIHALLKQSFIAEKVFYVVVGLSSLYCLRLLKIIYHARWTSTIAQEHILKFEEDPRKQRRLSFIALTDQ